MRYAEVSSDRIEEIRRYLPDNYKATHTVRGVTYIQGIDKAGWTLDAYVLPRLASGLFFGREIVEDWDEFTKAMNVLSSETNPPDEDWDGGESPDPWSPPLP